MDTKETIIKEAFLLFINNGYDNTSLEDVANKVGITKPAIYYHFKNKDELFSEITDFFLTNMTKMITSYTETENIKTFFKNMFLSLDEMIIYFQSFMGIVDNSTMLKAYFFIFDAIKRIPGFRNKIRKVYQISTNDFKKVLLRAKDKNEIRDDLDYDSMAFELNALLEGIMLMKIVDPSLELDKIGKKIFKNYWIRLG